MSNADGVEMNTIDAYDEIHILNLNAIIPFQLRRRGMAVESVDCP